MEHQVSTASPELGKELWVHEEGIGSLLGYIFMGVVLLAIGVAAVIFATDTMAKIVAGGLFGSFGLISIVAGFGQKGNRFAVHENGVRQSGGPETVNLLDRDVKSISASQLNTKVAGINSSREMTLVMTPTKASGKTGMVFTGRYSRVPKPLEEYIERISKQVAERSLITFAKHRKLRWPGFGLIDLDGLLLEAGKGVYRRFKKGLEPTSVIIDTKVMLAKKNKEDIRVPLNSIAGVGNDGVFISVQTTGDNPNLHVPMQAEHTHIPQLIETLANWASEGSLQEKLDSIGGVT